MEEGRAEAEVEEDAEDEAAVLEAGEVEEEEAAAALGACHG